MQLASQTVESDQNISPSIRAGLIDSFFETPGPVLSGIIFMAFAAAMTALKTGEILIWASVVLLIVAGALRAFDLHRYQTRKSSLTADQMAHWKKRYQIGVMMQAAAIGLWCATTLLSNDDAVAHMICLSVTTGVTAAGAGRAYGRQSIFHLQIALTFGPTVMALALRGTPYYVAMSVVSVVFVVALVQISANSHRIFVRALVAREREAALASQFDTALNNMPHGLCMFAADGRLAVMNHRFSEIMNLSDDLVYRGANARDIVAACVGAGSISAVSGQMILAEIENSQARDIITTDPDAARGRSLSWTFQPMAGGGAVVLLEDITERRNAEARITHLARYDELTALPNRVNFRDEIERLLTVPHDVEQLSALLFVDLDQFKQVNDTLGHPCGDQLLCAVSERLRGMLRPEDFVARFGGDEFVVFQQGIKSSEEAAGLARRIVDHLSERYRIDNHLVEIGASVGIAMAVPGVSADTLLKNADMALYRAKADGRGTFCFFRDEMAQIVEARRILELDLRKALANEEFELFYQPLVNLKSGRIATCEALLRWNHPVRGAIPPDRFVPVAETSGLMKPLGEWVLRRALSDARRWPGLFVSVNLSPVQVRDAELVDLVGELLAANRLPPERVVIEVTEGVLIDKPDEARARLDALRGLGVKLALDDFGTGYSSLGYLQRFRFDKLKIDRSFVAPLGRRADSQAMLQAIVALGRALDLGLLAEGVETEEQRVLLRLAGCDEMQGFLFARPLPAEAFDKLLEESVGDRAVPRAA
jgi:diguanylate cyclase (GGDEF)-like protein